MHSPRGAYRCTRKCRVIARLCAAVVHDEWRRVAEGVVVVTKTDIPAIYCPICWSPSPWRRRCRWYGNSDEIHLAIRHIRHYAVIRIFFSVFCGLQINNYKYHIYWSCLLYSNVCCTYWSITHIHLCVEVYVRVPRHSWEVMARGPKRNGVVRVHWHTGNPPLLRDFLKDLLDSGYMSSMMNMFLPFYTCI
jgi:hypothetical protein